MTAHEFSVSVHDLDAAGKAFRFPVRQAWVRGALEGSEVGVSEKDGELDVRLSKSGNDVVVHGVLRAELVVPCARCLEPARIAVDERVSALVVPGPAAAASSSGRREREEREDEQPADEADVIPYDGETVVLDELVRDELLLSIPMIPLCSEACPGIRPEAPSDSPNGGSVDPRLRGLLRLKGTT